MDEMTRVREMRADAPAPDRARLAEGRQRLADTAGKGNRGRAIRADWRLTALGAAAAVIVAVLIGGQLTGDAGKGATPAAGRVVVEKPPLDDAAELLGRIADAAERRADPQPKVGQWVYVKTQSLDEEAEGHGEAEQESWYLYADPAFENWKEGDDHSHRERYEFLADLPADPEKAFAKMRKFYPSGGFEESRNAHNYRAASVLAGHFPAPPEGMARLYRAMATLDGISVVDHLVEDATGQKAIAVYVKPEKGDWDRSELLFDPRTLDYVGSRVVAVEDQPDDFGGMVDEEDRIKKGDVFISSVVLRTAMVNEEGQRP